MARDFGTTSPKTRTISVSAPVTIPIAAEPKISVARTVVIAVAAIFTKLFPTRIVIKALWWWCFSFARYLEPGRFASTRVLTFAGERVISAVSLAEKKPERKRSIMTRTKSEVTERFNFYVQRRCGRGVRLRRGNDTGLWGNGKGW